MNQSFGRRHGQDRELDLEAPGERGELVHRPDLDAVERRVREARVRIEGDGDRKVLLLEIGRAHV